MRTESSHIEKEFKISAEEQDFPIIRDWIRRRVGIRYGARRYQRSRVYFDTADRRLLEADASFRKNLHSHEYCLKLPGSIGLDKTHRREFFLKITSPIDIFDPFDRSYVVVQKLIDVIGGDPAWSQHGPIDFGPVVVIDQEREIFTVFSPEGGSMVHIVLDINFAHSLCANDSGQKAIWREVEIENHESFARFSGFAASLAVELAALLGRNFQPLSKYAVAHELARLGGQG